MGEMERVNRQQELERQRQAEEAVRRKRAEEAAHRKQAEAAARKKAAADADRKKPKPPVDRQDSQHDGERQKPKPPVDRQDSQHDGERQKPTPERQSAPNRQTTGSKASESPLSPQVQEKLRSVQQAEAQQRKADAQLPADTASVTLTADGKSDHYEQWLKAAQGQVGPGDAKGAEQYFDENRRTLKTLEWLLHSKADPAQEGQNPELNRPRIAGRGIAVPNRTNYYAAEYKDYLAPPKDPATEKVSVVALKKGTIEALTGNAPRNGTEIVRAVTKTGPNGQVMTEYLTKGDNGWVPLRGLQPDVVMVSVDANGLSKNQHPKSLQSTVNIAGGEPHTHKRHNHINNNYSAYTNPTFTRYQQLRGDAPRSLNGSDLRNEIGVAMNFMPNNVPQTPEDEKALREGKWDYFSSNGAPPEMTKHLTPEQKQKLDEQFKQQHENLTKVEAAIKATGGDTAKVTTLPIMVDSPELGGMMQVPLFRVQGKDGKDRFVDNTGRTYDSMQDWKENNKLPPGRVSYFEDGHISSTPDGKPKIVTEDTHAVPDTFWEKAKPWLDGIVTAVGVLAAGAAIIGTGGAALPFILGGVAAYGAVNAGSTLYDRASHGETINPLQDGEARGAWIDLTTNVVGVAAIASSMRAANAVSKVTNASGEVMGASDDVARALQTQRFAQGVNNVSMAGDATNVGNQTYNLATQWQNLSPEQRMMTMGQIAFWGGMGVHSARSNQSGAYGTEELTRHLDGYRAYQEGRSPQINESTMQRTPIAPDSPMQQMAQIRQRLQKGEITEAEAQAELKQLRQNKTQSTPAQQATESTTTQSNSLRDAPKDRAPQPQSSEKQPTAQTTQAKEIPQSQTPQKTTLDQTGLLQQKTNNLDELYIQAEAAQQDLSSATNRIAKLVGGEPLIPPSLKGRDRTLEKINTEYDGDASRITDLARSSIVCDNPQQIQEALGALQSKFSVVRMKDRFQAPVNGYRDMLINLEMPNGHIVEVQLHLRGVLDVKNGTGHQLYEQTRSIRAKAKAENRPLTAEEAQQIQALERQQKQLYDEAYERSLQPTTDKSDGSPQQTSPEKLSAEEVIEGSNPKIQDSSNDNQPKLSTGAKLGKEASPAAIREGSVQMEEHPQYEASLQQAKDSGFSVKYTEGDPHVTVREIVDSTGKVIRVEKELNLQAGMRYLDLEHELGHIKQLERFGENIPPTQRLMEQPDGVLREAPNQQGVLTTWQDPILEYHNRLDEFLRLSERGANRELLEEHMEGVEIWATRYHEKGLKGGRSPSRVEWANEYFPDIPELRNRYDQAVKGLEKE
jgi:hypothetical protein